MAKKILITETVLRDAHQSLLATRMPLSDMEPILEKMDKIGFYSLECWGGATFDACMRFLNEDPWIRLRTIKDKCPIDFVVYELSICNSISQMLFPAPLYWHTTFIQMPLSSAGNESYIFLTPK